MEQVVLNYSKSYHSLLAKNIKLCINPNYWHKIIIHNHDGTHRDVILKAVLDAIHPNDLIPVHYTVEEGGGISFLARNCKTAIEKLCQQSLVIPNPQNRNLAFKLTIILGFSNTNELKINVQDNVVQVLTKRYNSATKTLNLDNFYKDPDLEEFCVLSQPKILYFVLHLSKNFIVQHLKLSNNDISILSPVESLWGSKHLTSLDLRNNSIKSMKELTILRSLSIHDLWLDGNPLCDDYDDYTYVQAVKELCPQIEKLDGMLLRQAGYPAFRRNYLCNPESQELIDNFLEHYFTIYDNPSKRNMLINIYDKDASFSISSQYIVGQSTSATARLTAYKLLSRNIRTLSDLAKSDENLVVGNEKIIKVLSKLPKTEHDPYTFTVDLVYYTDEIITLIVTGVFREPSERLATPEKILGFTRTFVLSSNGNNEYRITNEQLHVSNATTAQQQRAFKVVRVQKTNVIGDEHSSAINDTEKKERIEAVKTLTTMNSEWSKKCLEECGYNMVKALTLFVDLYKVDNIPEEAFIRDPITVKKEKNVKRETLTQINENPLQENFNRSKENCVDKQVMPSKSVVSSCDKNIEKSANFPVCSNVASNSKSSTSIIANSVENSETPPSTVQNFPERVRTKFKGIKFTAVTKPIIDKLRELKDAKRFEDLDLEITKILELYKQPHYYQLAIYTYYEMGKLEKARKLRDEVLKTLYQNGNAHNNLLSACVCCEVFLNQEEDVLEAVKSKFIENAKTIKHRLEIANFAFSYNKKRLAGAIVNQTYNNIIESGADIDKSIFDYYKFVFLHRYGFKHVDKSGKKLEAKESDTTNKKNETVILNDVNESKESVVTNWANSETSSSLSLAFGFNSRLRSFFRGKRSKAATKRFIDKMHQLKVDKKYDELDSEIDKNVEEHKTLPYWQSAIYTCYEIGNLEKARKLRDQRLQSLKGFTYNNLVKACACCEVAHNQDEEVLKTVKDKFLENSKTVSHKLEIADFAFGYQKTELASSIINLTYSHMKKFDIMYKEKSVFYCFIRSFEKNYGFHFKADEKKKEMNIKTPVNHWGNETREAEISNTKSKELQEFMEKNACYLEARNIPNFPANEFPQEAKMWAEVYRTYLLSKKTEKVLHVRSMANKRLIGEKRHKFLIHAALVEFEAGNETGARELIRMLPNMRNKIFKNNLRRLLTKSDAGKFAKLLFRLHMYSKAKLVVEVFSLIFSNL